MASTPGRKPHGILKGDEEPASSDGAAGRRHSRGRASVRWDEANLAETAAEAGSAHRMRIDEPKTPWVAPAAPRAPETDDDFVLCPSHASPCSSVSSLSSSPGGSGSLFSATESEGEESPARHHAAFQEARRRHYRLEAVPAAVQRVAIDDDRADDEARVAGSTAK